MVNNQTLESAQQYLVQHLPNSLRACPPRIQALQANTVILRQALQADLIHSNGQLDFPSYTTLACLAMQLAHLEVSKFLVQTFNTSFCDQPKGAYITLHATTLRRGRTLIFGDVKAYDDKEQLVAHSTCTFSL